ncbi:MAG: membrane dipeptidase [Betaproteobacteria bacterium]
MKRRQFLGYCAAGVCATCGDFALGRAQAEEISADQKLLAGLLIADPHAHPYPLFSSRNYDPATPTIEIMKSLGMALCSFSAVGDLAYHRNRLASPFSDTQNQLRQVERLVEKGQLQLVLKSADLPTLVAAPEITRGLMAIEGGDALGGSLDNLNVFFQQGVRLITVMHDRDNEIGFNQRSSGDGQLTAFGEQLIERMNALGMVVDVAHAKTATLKSIAEVCATPLIDSHTSPYFPGEEGSGPRRLRTWAEMEWIAKSGGVVCTWPFAFSGKNSERTTLRHWADEIVLMKSRLGIEHCGLGTDGGGGLPRMIKGWDSIASLPLLIAAMREAGLTQNDIAAFAGGNFLRVLGQCLA